MTRDNDECLSHVSGVSINTMCVFDTTCMHVIDKRGCIKKKVRIRRPIQFPYPLTIHKAKKTSYPYKQYPKFSVVANYPPMGRIKHNCIQNFVLDNYREDLYKKQANVAE